MSQYPVWEVVELSGTFHSSLRQATLNDNCECQLLAWVRILPLLLKNEVTSSIKWGKTNSFVLHILAEFPIGARKFALHTEYRS